MGHTSIPQFIALLQDGGQIDVLTTLLHLPSGKAWPPLSTSSSKELRIRSTTGEERGFGKTYGVWSCLWGCFSLICFLEQKPSRTCHFPLAGCRLGCAGISLRDKTGRAKDGLSQLIPHRLPQAQWIRDRPVWSWDPEHTFSVRGAYYRLNDEGLWCPFAKIIWSIKAPLKVRAFLWLVIRCALLMWDNLMKMNWQGASVCALCMIDSESINHLFVTCPFSRHIWGEMARHLSLSFL